MRSPPPDKPDKPDKVAKESKEARKLKSLASEMATLRADMDSVMARLAVGTPAGAPAASPEAQGVEERLRSALSAPADAAVLYALAYRIEAAGVAGSHAREVGSLADVLRADTERVARIAYAFSSPPKVALIRLLLAEGPQSAAVLGEKAGLSTGSLYHHLRELVHGEVLRQTGRNQYALTALGQQAALLLFVLAGGDRG